MKKSYGAAFLRWSLALLIALMATAHARAVECGVEQATVMKPVVTVGNTYATLTGIVRQMCPTAVGVEVKWTAYNSDGTVAFSENFWPASTTNIPPNTDYPFEMMNSAPRGKWTYTVAPISVYTW